MAGSRPRTGRSRPAERLGIVKIAVETLATKGAIAVYAGRHWEARVLLEGARVLANENDLPDVALRASGMLASTIALDDPVASVAVERESIALARRLGRRDYRAHLAWERRGGCPADRRLGRGRSRTSRRPCSSISTRSSRLDPATASYAYFRLLQGRLGGCRAGDPRRGPAPELERYRCRSRDATTSKPSPTSPSVTSARRVRALDGDRAGVSDLNRPYVLPRAGTAAALAVIAAMVRVRAVRPTRRVGEMRPRHRMPTDRQCEPESRRSKGDHAMANTRSTERRWPCGASLDCHGTRR